MIRDSRQVLTELLVLDAQRGSERAFRDLHDLWQPDLRRMVRVRVDHPDSVDDVLTEVWLAIARGLSGLDDPACFPRWAFQIVHRRSADWVRKRMLDRRREEMALAEVEQLAPAAPAAEPEPSDDVTAIRAAILQLPSDQQQLLHLHYQLERSIAEIAAVLDIPPGTVKSRLFSIRETLKRKLERKNSHE
ncbi:sigma-70 family RNA polymerase sigma factor [soil metagenome]